MQFYFYNSYQQSPVGFQESWIASGKQALELVESNWCQNQELNSALFHSGAACLVGRGTGGEDYFLIRNVTVKDETGRKWYIYMGVEGDPSERQDFCALVRGILMEHDRFRQVLAECFRPRKGTLSYALDAGKFWTYVAGTAQKPVKTDEFYDQDHVFTNKLRAALESMEDPALRGAALLVPDGTYQNFINQNPVFQGRKIGQQIPAKAFACLLNRDPALLDMAEEPEPVKPEEQTSRLRAMANFVRNMRERFFLLLLIGTVGTFVMVRIFGQKGV